MSDEVELIIVGTLDCGSCGLTLFPTRNDGLYEDEQVIRCICGAHNTISVDEDDAAYVGHWKCRHGIEQDDPCDTCEAIPP